MVYTPCKYLVPAAIALVASQMQQAAGYSMFYAPETTPGTADEVSDKFPAYGAEVDAEDCTYTVVVDPTLPDITTISTVPVKFTELLANTSAPTEPVSAKVGTPVLQETTPVVDADQDAYTQGVTTQIISAPVPGKADDKPKDCATGWEEPTAARKLLESEHRRLDTRTNRDITSIEAYFNVKLDTLLKDLPTVGVHVPSPWPAPYWPMYQDSINVEWSEGQPSAAAKYAMAFGHDVEDFMNTVSKIKGVDARPNNRKCKTDDDCASPDGNTACAIRAGQSSGVCIPTWFGICHAWSVAAMLEPEPKCPVTHNGVTFQPLDIKGLLSLAYDGSHVRAVLAGASFKRGKNVTDSVDEYGRHTNPAYRDLNPGLFHIVTTNLIGKLNATFIADVEAGYEVWNQPVRGFKVYEQTAMSLEEAAQTFYGLEKYPWNAAAKSIVYVKTRLSWIFESYRDGPLVSSGEVDNFTTGAYYYYLLELDNAGKIIGGEWVYNSDENHPDVLWFPRGKPALDTVTKVGLSYADVSLLLEKSQVCEDSSSGSTSAGSDGSSTSGSTSAGSTSASTSGSTGVTGSAAQVSSSSTAGSNTDGSVSTPTETPAATYTNTGSPDVTTEAPASTTATPSENNNGNSEGENDDNHLKQIQRFFTGFFHWG